MHNATYEANAVGRGKELRKCTRIANVVIDLETFLSQCYSSLLYVFGQPIENCSMNTMEKSSDFQLYLYASSLVIQIFWLIKWR